MSEKRVDCNCMIGGWPFHRVRNPGFEDLKKMHARAGITGGLVSSTDAIFWNDPYEAERILAKTLEGQSDYKHIMTVNPTLVGWRDDLVRAEREFNVAGVRVTPGFHGYSMDHPEMQALAEEVKKRGWILIVTVHMEDERVAYLLKYNAVPVDEMQAFLTKNADQQILLANIRVHEVKKLSDIILANDNILCDISGFKDLLFVMEDMQELGFVNKLVYGSMSPLFCITSTTLMLDECSLDKSIVDSVYRAKALYK